MSWNFAVNQPSMVVINLGGNDFSTAVDSLKFTNAYLRFIKRVRKNYPHSIMVCIGGPSGDGEKFNSQVMYIQSVVNEFKKGDKSVHYFSFSTFQMNGCDWHPNVAEHKIMASELIPFLKSLLK